MTAETTVFVPQHHGGTRATNVKQTKTRGTSMLDTHRRPHAHTHRLPSGETREQESDSEELSVLEEDGEADLQTNNATVCMRAITRLHACSHTDTHNGCRQSAVGTITVNTDGRRGEEIAL